MTPRRSQYLTEMLTDLSAPIGFVTTLLFAGPELTQRAGWWPKPLFWALVSFWALVIWRRSADAKKHFEDAARGGP